MSGFVSKHPVLATLIVLFGVVPLVLGLFGRDN